MYLLYPDIVNQVSIDERKNNPLSSPSGLTISVSALTNDSVSTPTTKRCLYFTDDSLSKGKKIAKKPKCNLNHWLGSYSLFL